jgi:GMP synthase (glutamine-hydrolysing) A subunit
MHEIILILDFGSQYTQLIARRLRELGVKTMIERGDLPAAEIEAVAPVAMVLSGGPASVFDSEALRPDPVVFRLGVPVLGICYGMHLMAQVLGGEVRASNRREYGLAELESVGKSPLLDPTPEVQPVWMSHGAPLPTPGASCSGYSFTLRSSTHPTVLPCLQPSSSSPVVVVTGPRRRFATSWSPGCASSCRRGGSSAVSPAVSTRP